MLRGHYPDLPTRVETDSSGLYIRAHYDHPLLSSWEKNGDSSSVDSKYFVQNIFHLHGFPDPIVSDSDAKFTSNFLSTWSDPASIQYLFASWSRWGNWCLIRALCHERLLDMSNLPSFRWNRSRSTNVQTRLRSLCSIEETLPRHIAQDNTGLLERCPISSVLFSETIRPIM